MKFQTVHMLIGFVVSLLVGAFLVLRINVLWSFQKAAIQRLLDFAEVPFRIPRLPVADLRNGLPVFYKPGGNTINVPIEYQALTTNQALTALAVLVFLGVLVYLIQRIPLPFKVMTLFLLVLICSTILYTSFVSPVPPHTLNKLSIDWQYSGAIVLFIISIIFAFSVFPVKGPLWIKMAWLGGTLIWAVIWNLLRLSVVLSTFYHLGSSVFLLTHYMTGIYIDFIYIVVFYSLALAHLAKHEVSEVGW